MGSIRRKRALSALTVAAIMVFLCCCGPERLSAGLPPEKGDACEDPAPAGESLPPSAEKTAPHPAEENRAGAGEAGAASPEQESSRQSSKASSRGNEPVSGLEKQRSPALPGPQRARKSGAKAQRPPEPPSYIWGGAHRVTFRSRVRLTNTGVERAENVWVDLPMLENSSPYQKTTLKSASPEPAYMSGRIGAFGVGDIEPGAAVVIETDYQIVIRPLSIRSTDETVEKARQAFQLYSGSGNCCELAKSFVRRCREWGLKARVVNGYARAGGGDIAAGSLKGCRHSWAEFHLDGLGWVPVDLTFNYFAAFPRASHLVETYADEAVKVYHLGGKISVIWENEIL